MEGFRQNAPTQAALYNSPEKALEDVFFNEINQALENRPDLKPAADALIAFLKHEEKAKEELSITYETSENMHANHVREVSIALFEKARIIRACNNICHDQWRKKWLDKAINKFALAIEEILKRTNQADFDKNDEKKALTDIKYYAERFLKQAYDLTPPNHKEKSNELSPSPYLKLLFDICTSVANFESVSIIKKTKDEIRAKYINFRAGLSESCIETYTPKSPKPPYSHILGEKLQNHAKTCITKAIAVQDVGAVRDCAVFLSGSFLHSGYGSFGYGYKKRKPSYEFNYSPSSAAIDLSDDIRQLLELKTEKSREIAKILIEEKIFKSNYAGYSIINNIPEKELFLSFLEKQLDKFDGLVVLISLKDYYTNFSRDKLVPIFTDERALKQLASAPSLETVMPLFYVRRSNEDAIGELMLSKMPIDDFRMFAHRVKSITNQLGENYLETLRNAVWKIEEQRKGETPTPNQDALQARALELLGIDRRNEEGLV